MDNIRISQKAPKDKDGKDLPKVEFDFYTNGRELVLVPKTAKTVKPQTDAK